MSDTVIQVNTLSKKYQLGTVGTNTLKGDIQQWWYRISGRPELALPIGKSSKREEVWALKNINFSLKQGEVLGLIGKNGAGKSTLLKVLSRITTPTTGNIQIKGRIASLLEVGTGFHYELTGLENIYLNGAILGMHRHEIKRKLDEIIDFSGVEKYIDTPVKRYSSGMYVRLAFAVAAHLEPEILVIDEVLAVGDAAFQHKAIGKMQDVAQQQGRTVLFVSHNMTLVRRLCQRGIVLNGGGIAFDGTTGDAIQHYLTQLSDDGQHNGQRRSQQAIWQDASKRKGTGQLRLQKITCNPHLPTAAIQTGEPLVIQFSFVGEANWAKDKLQVDFRIDNEWGDRVLWLSSRLLNKTLSSHHVQFRFPKCPLSPGKYFITLQVVLNQEQADWVDNAASFTVHEGDFYHTGQKIPRMQTNLWADFEVENT